MQNCSACRSQLAAYLEGDLPAQAMGEVSAHIQSCESCAKLCASERAMMYAVRELPTAAPPAELRSRVRHAVYLEREIQRAAKPLWQNIFLGAQSRLIWAGGASLSAFGLLLFATTHEPGGEVTPFNQNSTPSSATLPPAKSPKPFPHQAPIVHPIPATATTRGVPAQATTPKPKHSPEPIEDRPRVAVARPNQPRPAAKPRITSQTQPDAAKKLTPPQVRPAVQPDLARPDHDRIATPSLAERPLPESGPPAPLSGGELFLAGADWIGSKSTSLAGGPNTAEALRATGDANATNTGAPRSIRLKVTPQRDVVNCQIRAIVAKAEDGKAGEINEIVWSGDATAKAPIAILWEPELNSARRNISITLVLEQVDPTGKATPIQTQTITLGDQ